MFEERLTADAKSALKGAISEALRLGHDWVGSEDLLLGLMYLRVSAASDIMFELGLRPGQLRRQVTARRRESGESPGTLRPRMSTELKETFRLAMHLADGRGDADIDCSHFLLALCRKRHSPAREILQQHGISEQVLPPDLFVTSEARVIRNLAIAEARRRRTEVSPLYLVEQALWRSRVARALVAICNVDPTLARSAVVVAFPPAGPKPGRADRNCCVLPAAAFSLAQEEGFARPDGHHVLRAALASSAEVADALAAVDLTTEALEAAYRNVTGETGRSTPRPRWLVRPRNDDARQQGATRRPAISRDLVQRRLRDLADGCLPAQATLGAWLAHGPDTAEEGRGLLEMAARHGSAEAAVALTGSARSPREVRTSAPLVADLARKHEIVAHELGDALGRVVDCADEAETWLRRSAGLGWGRSSVALGLLLDGLPGRTDEAEALATRTYDEGWATTCNLALHVGHDPERFEEAKALLAPEAEAGSVCAVVNLASLLIDRDPADARLADLLDRPLSNDTFAITALWMLASGGDLQEAERCAKAAVNARKSEGLALVQVLAAQPGREAEALEILRKAATSIRSVLSGDACAPGFVRRHDYFVRLGHLLLTELLLDPASPVSAQAQEAESVALRALEVTPRDPEALGILALALCWQGRLEAARAPGAAHLSGHPGCASAVAMAAWSRLGSGDREGAVTLLASPYASDREPLVRHVRKLVAAG